MVPRPVRRRCGQRIARPLFIVNSSLSDRLAVRGVDGLLRQGVLALDGPYDQAPGGGVKDVCGHRAARFNSVQPDCLTMRSSLTKVVRRSTLAPFILASI